jgi:hypothetical protein
MTLEVLQPNVSTGAVFSAQIASLQFPKISTWLGLAIKRSRWGATHLAGEPLTTNGTHAE